MAHSSWGPVLPFEVDPAWHTPECIAQALAAIDAREAFLEAHPQLCVKCSGYGLFVSPATQWEPENTDPCPECTEKGICPLCGLWTLSHEDKGDGETGAGPCSNPKCGWNYDQTLPEFDGCPGCSEHALEQQSQRCFDGS